MKHPDRGSVDRLEALPNIGQSIADHLRLIDIHHPRQLIGQDALSLHGKLSRIKGYPADPCLIDVFMSAIDFMEGAEPRPWWTYTPQRKQLLSDR